MAGNYRAQVEGYIFYDAAATGYAVSKYTAVSMATAGEVATANAAGVRGNAGEVVIPTPVAAGLATRRCVGVTVNSVINGGEVQVAVAGVADVMCNAAVAAESILSPAVLMGRTSAQTPFTNVLDALIPTDPLFARNYVGTLADDTAIPLAAGGANVIYYPIGIALVAATAQYDIIPVRLWGGAGTLVA